MVRPCEELGRELRWQESGEDEGSKNLGTWKT